MKAMVLDSFSDISALHLAEVPEPVPEPNQVVIALKYAAVNPVDWKICEGMLKERLPHAFPLIPGWDGSGVIKALGAAVKGFKVGEAVFGYFRKPTVQWGTFSEAIAFEAENIAKKPENISFAQAAALPLTALTAWQALFDVAKIRKGERVLVHAGAGGVGSMAIQLAKNAGAHVLTTTSKKNEAYVRDLGAEWVIDYTTQDFVREVKKVAPQGVDVVLDCVGGETLKRSLECIKRGGRLVSIVQHLAPDAGKEGDISIGYVFVRPSGEQLEKIAALIRQGKLRPPAIEELPFKNTIQALQKNRAGHTRGKIVIRISDDA